MLHNRFNPLRSKHEDTPPANTGTAAPATPEAAPETEQAPEVEKKEDEPETEPAPETTPTDLAANTGKLNAFQRTALRALGTGDLIARVERAEAGEQVALAEATRLKAENSRLTSELAKLNTETPAKIEAAKKVHDKEVSNGVLNELGKIGISAAEAPSQVSADATPEAMLEHFATLKGAEKTAYWRANSKALKASSTAAKNSN